MRSHDDSGRRPDAFDAASPGGTGLTPLRVGLIGYGLAGSAFHAPLVEAVPGLALASVVTSNPERGADARSAHPDAEVITSADELFNAAHAHDLVVVAAPNRHHVPLALRAVEAGLHVVVDKPLAGSAGEGRRLADAVAARGVVASVFHNRRWDGDFLTLRRLVSEGALGEVWRLESRFERWRPQVRDDWHQDDPAGGVLHDLGTHLIDQALVLLGPVRGVHAEVAVRRPGARREDDAFLALIHASGAVSHLWVSATSALPGPRLRALGSGAGFEKHGMDPQEARLRGAGPEPRERAVLGAGDDVRPVAVDPGDYPAFYAGVVAALRDGAPPPVALDDAIAGLEIVDQALER